MAQLKSGSTVGGVAIATVDQAAPVAGVFFQSNQTLTTGHVIPGTVNAASFGPVQIASGVTVTISSGATWRIYA